jgi:hypothetical protein
MADSSLTLSEIQTKITAIRTDIEAAESAASYGKGDKQVSRQMIGSLQTQLNRYLRQERELTAAANGANNSGVITASWS